MDDQVTQFIFTPNLVTQWAAGVGDEDMDVDDDKANWNSCRDSSRDDSSI